MKKIILLLKIVSLLSILVICTQAQITSRTTEVEKAEVRLSQIISGSESYFKQGNFNIEDGRLSQAWESFDKSVEVILLSGINVERNAKLKEHYLELIGRIYRIEATIRKKSVVSEKTSFEIPSKCNKSESGSDKSINVAELLNQAINFYIEGNGDEALSKLRYILAADPTNGKAYLILGKIHLRRGDMEQATSRLRTALFWNDRLIETHILLGKIYFDKGDLLQSQSYSRSALKINSENERAKALSLLIEGIETIEDKRILENDSIEFEKEIQESSKEVVVGKINNSDMVFVAPFQSGYNYDFLGGDFGYVLSELLKTPNLCVVDNENREKLLEKFGFDTDETFTLATAIKLAIIAKASLLVYGKYEKRLKNINVTAQIIRVNEGRILGEELSDGRRVFRDINLSDSISNLRILQGQLAYQILYQHDKSLPFSQNQFIDRVSKMKLPATLNIDGNSNNEPDFSKNNSLSKTTCDEKVLETLQLRNFRMEMNLSEVAKILPKAKIKNLSSYEKEIYQNFSNPMMQDVRFKDLTSIRLQFFNDRLFSIEIIYDDSIKWQNLDEFVLQVEKSLNLPKMKRGGYGFDGKYLYCGNYQFKAMLSKNKIPAIHLFNTKISNEIEQKNIEEKERKKNLEIEEKRRKKQVFKP